MRRFLKKRSKKIGLPPGSLMHIGEKKCEKCAIKVFVYDDQHFNEKEIQDARELEKYKNNSSRVWISVTGLHQIRFIEEVSRIFQLDALVLEDILNTDHRPKFEDYGDYLFMIIKVLHEQKEANELASDQVSLIIFPSLIISFQEREYAFFESLNDRLRSGKIRIRKMGSDYMAYSIVDLIVDHYFVVLDHLGERIERIEEEVIEDPRQSTFQEIQHLKRELIFLRRSIWPVREAISGMQNETDIVQERTLKYIKDVYDHTVQIIDTVESFRDVLSGLTDVYLSTMSNRLNVTMKSLTIIATIFMPLTLISGIYGMNFENMPELSNPLGYPIVLLGMLSITITMLLYFRWKKWF